MSTQPKHRKSIRIFIVLLAGILITAAFITTRLGARENSENAAHAKPSAMPVQVDVVNSSPTRMWREFSGSMEAVDLAEIRPQVSGTITEIRFQDGQHVNKGDVLYVIDPRPYAAAVHQAKAELAAARNAYTLAESVLERAEGLIKTAAISQRIYDERANEALVTQATVQAAEARLEQAEINLDYAFVKAPISGRTSRAEVKLGNLVSPGPVAPLLTTIVSNEGIYAEFEVDEQTYMNELHLATRIRNKDVKVPVEISVGDDQHIYKGFVHSLDNRIDSDSGTIRARAFLANEDKALLPGMFVSVRVGSPELQEKIMISERAIGTNQNRKFVYVVNEQKTAEYREVIIGDSIRGQRIVASGLKDGEMIISDGVIHVRPGMPVEPRTQSDLVSALSQEP